MNPPPGPMNPGGSPAGSPIVSLAGTPAASPPGSRPASPMGGPIVTPASPTASSSSAPASGPQVMQIQDIAKMSEWTKKNLVGIPNSSTQLDINLEPAGPSGNYYSIFNKNVIIVKDDLHDSLLSMITADGEKWITNQMPITDGIWALLIDYKSSKNKGIAQRVTEEEANWWYNLVTDHQMVKWFNGQFIVYSTNILNKKEL